MISSTNPIEIYQTADGLTQIDVHFQEETVWLNRQQLAELFGRDIKTIGKHVNNVFREGELEESASVAKFATVQKEGQREVQRLVDVFAVEETEEEQRIHGA